MREYLTETLILDKTAANENDLTADLYTKELGRLRAKITSGQKIISKLSPHLEPLNFSLIRLTEKNGFVLADALTQNHIEPFSQNLKLLAAIREMIFSGESDSQLWFWLKKSLNSQKQISFSQFLKILGYDPKLASCQKCHSKFVKYFLVPDQIFVFPRCVFRVPFNMLLLEL